MEETENVEDAWNNFCEGDYTSEPQSIISLSTTEVPKCSLLYISTKTKISYLNQPIDLKDIFWKIAVLPYHLPKEGIIKKQMKFNSSSPSELDEINKKLKTEIMIRPNHLDEYIIQNIDNPSGRIKFKDIRKISIGLSKKDITSYKCKKKSAFYNCFVVILRLKYGDTFKEHSVKVFNTGKLQIPGIQTDESLIKILNLLVLLLKPLVISDNPLNYIENKSETVLINSNFNCGYFINREKLYDILKFNYNINSAYDPCSYPGIQSEFFYNPNISIQTGQQSTANDNLTIVKVSFMIFRTGSVLIVGKCSEFILNEIYIFIKQLLVTEFTKICSKLKDADENLKIKTAPKRKIRKKTIVMINESVH